MNIRRVIAAVSVALALTAGAATSASAAGGGHAKPSSICITCW